MHNIIRKAVRDFCLEYVEHPYLSYTEHGQHALFFQRLYKLIPPSKRHFLWNGNRACIIQKEYPTASNLGKPTRQHWDIAVIKIPPKSTEDRHSFDYFKLDGVVEFGMNEAYDHLQDDVERMSHPDSNLDYGIAVHFHRLSKPGGFISGRDWSPKSKRIVNKDDLLEMVVNLPIEIWYAMSDSTKSYENGVWRINTSGIEKVEK